MNAPFSLPPIEIIFAVIWVLFFGIGIHEYCHCLFADMAGDPTPQYFGRVTLNLTKHFEPAGTVMMIVSSLTGFGIGWGKPAPINPEKMKHPRRDAFVAVAAGPISNLLQAILYASLLRISLRFGALTHSDVITAFSHEHTTILAAILTLGVVINLSLAVFNLIPLGPLDGHWLVGLSLPPKLAVEWFRFNRTTGGGLLIGIIILSQVFRFPVLGYIIGPPVYYLFKLLTGVPY